MPIDDQRQLDRRFDRIEELIDGLTTRAEDLTTRAEDLSMSAEDRSRLAYGVERLAEETIGLNDLLARVNEQQRQVSKLDARTDGLQTDMVAIVAATGDATRSRRVILRRLYIVAVGVLLLIGMGVLGAIYISDARGLVDQQQRNSIDFILRIRDGCDRGNLQRMVQIDREEALARTDLPATRDLHRRSAEALRRLQVNCVETYPLPPVP